MPAWLIRGLTLAVLHAAGVVTLGKIAVFRSTDTEMTIATSVVFALLIGSALTWSAVDGWLRRPDGGRTWVLAALIAGPTAGVLNVIGRAVFVDQTGASELGVQLTSGAAFTALLVLVPAGLGLFVGGRLESPRDAPSRHSTKKQDHAEPDGSAGKPTPRRADRRPVGKRPSPAPRSSGTSDG
ncbi:MAG: B-4DMT family transporter [Pseudonocardiaceae bacterium]